MLRRINLFAIVRFVSSMSPLIWIQPAELGGLFFAPNLRDSEKSRQALEWAAGFCRL
jgi:hypothetical protein